MAKLKIDWVIHCCRNGAPCAECGKVETGYLKFACNAHTHGMERYNHPDFQVVLNWPDNEIARILNTFGLWVQEGSLEGGIDGNRIGDIRPESVHLPEGRELLYSGLDGRFVDIPDDQLAGSFFQAQAAHDFANPGASSGNQHGFSLYLHGAKVVTFFAKK